MENVYPTDERYFNFLEDQVKELKAEKNQSNSASMFQALTGSRHRTRRRQVTGIPPMPITSESTPVSNLEVVTVTTPPELSKTEQIELAPEKLVPVPVVEVHMQPSVNNQLEGSYTMEAQVMQVENVSCHTSISSLTLLVHEYLKNNFNELLNDKVYNTFKELFENINIDSMKEAL